jgi:hypothetical protein
MSSITSSQLVALFVDAENINPNSIPQILRFCQSIGKLTFVSAYGNWNKTLSPHRDTMESLGISCVQVEGGKNATDHRLMIEAGELLGKGAPSVFVIVSGDKDFVQLHERIHQHGIMSLGIGDKSTSSKKLRNAFWPHIYVEDLDSWSSREIWLLRAHFQTQLETGISHVGKMKIWLSEVVENFAEQFPEKKFSKSLDKYANLFVRQGNEVRLTLNEPK